MDVLRAFAMPALFAMPAAPLLWPDHVYVSSDTGQVWECFGRAQGGTELAHGNGESRIAECLSNPKNSQAVPPIYAGLTYARHGVCHQAANRVLFQTGIQVA
jgi:hypothetical protein